MKKKNNNNDRKNEGLANRHEVHATQVSSCHAVKMHAMSQGSPEA